MAERTIFTVGHSIRSLQDFIQLLLEFDIHTLADIRLLPGSKRYPHFNQESLQACLDEKAIHYIHFKSLGGRRQPRPDSKNTAWRSMSFRGYADYMETPEFQAAIIQLEELADASRTAYMCSEAVWWNCHRALVSDFFKIRGWKVMHIMGPGKLEEHPYTSAARIRNNQLSYMR